MDETAGDTTLLDALAWCHDRLAADLRASLAERASGDGPFRATLTSWAAPLGVGDSGSGGRDDTAGRVADQIAFRLVAGRLLAARSDRVATPAVDERWLDLDVTITDTGNGAVIEHDDVAEPIRLAGVDGSLARVVAEHDPTRFDTAGIGRLYERALPDDRRSERGEFYTPPALCDLVSRLTIRESDDTVLDPACGAGSFLLSASDRKRALATEQPGAPGQRVEQVAGIDIDELAARLSAVALALGTGESNPDDVAVRVDDFFDVDPPAEGYDAVVGNPPYVRGRSLDLDYKDAVRAHLPTVDAEWLTRKMDLYGYFLTHATSFLREGGRLGFVLSDRWLDTQYGTDLQRFVREHYRIEAVVRFRQQAFDDALVGSTIVVLQREDERAAREDNVVSFVDVRDDLTVDETVSLVEADEDPGQLAVTDEYRRVTIRQRRLGDIAKWNGLFIAPPIYFDLLAAETVELRDRADLHTGLESGANDFFYRRRAAIEDLGLEAHFSPLVRASGQIDAIRFGGDADGADWGVFDVSGLVADALDADERFGNSPAEQAKGWLAARGYDDVLDYVERGESEGHHVGSRRCQRRDVWFAIDDLDRYRPPLAIPLFCWRLGRVVANEAGGVVDRQFHSVVPHDGVDERVLCGILNARSTWLAREIDGRHAGGEGMTRLQLVKYEAGGLAIPDPNALSTAERDRIVAALDDLYEREATLRAEGVTDPATQLERTEDERDALDRAVLATLGMADRLDELKASVSRLVAARGDGAATRSTAVSGGDDERTVVEFRSVPDDGTE